MGKTKAGKTPPPVRGKYFQVHLSIPQVYLDVLTKEAELVGVPRSNLLVMLLKKRRAGLGLERPKNAPTYSFKPKDFEKTTRYVWYVTPEVRATLDEDCLILGNVNLPAWLAYVLNEWIGRKV